MFENQNEITDLGISPISVVEEMAKDIREKSNVECKFYESAEDVPDPRELSSEKKKSNSIWWSVTWKTNHMWIVLC